MGMGIGRTWNLSTWMFRILFIWQKILPFFHGPDDPRRSFRDKVLGASSHGQSCEGGESAVVGISPCAPSGLVLVILNLTAGETLRCNLPYDKPYRRTRYLPGSRRARLHPPISYTSIIYQHHIFIFISISYIIYRCHI